MVMLISSPVEVDTFTGHGEKDAHYKVPIHEFDFPGYNTHPVHDAVIYISLHLENPQAPCVVGAVMAATASICATMLLPSLHSSS
jgi:hypothetical protein